MSAIPSLLSPPAPAVLARPDRHPPHEMRNELPPWLSVVGLFALDLGCQRPEVVRKSTRRLPLSRDEAALRPLRHSPMARNIESLARETEGSNPSRSASEPVVRTGDIGNGAEALTGEHG